MKECDTILKKIEKVISVIVPIFNAERTLEKCLESICKQSYKNLEILLIDDGSTDNSSEIIKKFISKDKRIKTFKQQNSGPAEARNLGLKKANGDYIAFIDADDYIKIDTYEKMITAIELHKSDMVICGFEYEKNDKRWTINQGIKKGHYTGERLREITLNFIFSTEENRIRPFTPLRLIKKTIIDSMQITFDSNLKRSEDYLFLALVHMNIKSLEVITDQILYTYTQNSISISHSYVENYPQMVLEIYKRLLLEIEKNNDDELKKRVEFMVIYRLQIILFNELLSSNKFYKKFVNVKTFLNSQEVINIIKKIKFNEGVKKIGKIYILIFLHLDLLLFILFSLKYKNKRKKL